MLNYEFPPIGGGGGNAHLHILTEYAAQKQLEVDVLTSAPKPGFTSEQFSDNIRIYKVGIHKKQLHYWRKVEVIEWLAKAAGRYRELLKTNHYDLVHAFFGFPSGWMCYRTAAKLPYIISLRGSDVPGYNVRLGLDYHLLAGLFRRIWSSAAAVVANSQGLKKLAQQFMPELDIEVIPNGIDTEKFQPPQSKSPGKPIRALAVGRLINRKRIDLLIEAIARARKAGLDVTLSIAGQGNLLAELQAIAGKLNVTDRIIFMGRVPPEQMPQVYREHDIFLMSSAHEGMSNAMLEAMASGLPIVTTRCEGVAELITDNGIVLDRPEPEKIASAINQIDENRALYDSMSACSREQAEKFNWLAVADKYIDCYNNILDRTSRS